MALRVLNTDRMWPRPKLFGRFPWLLAGMLLLVVATGWLVGPLLERHELEKADVRLTAALNAAAAESTRAFAAAQVEAGALASSPSVQQALIHGDRGSILALERRHPNVFVALGGYPAVRNGPVSSAEVKSGARVLGRVDVSVPLTNVLKRVERASSSVLLFTRGGRVVGHAGAGEPLALTPGRAANVRLSGMRYRALAAPLPAGERVASTLVALEPRSAIVARAAARRNLVILAALASLIAVFLATWIAQRAPWHDRRLPQPARPHDRVRMSAREALALVGDALAATHEPRALLAVILNAVTEATGAVGGRLLDDGVELTRVGVLPEGAEPLNLELREGGKLQLFPPTHGFGAADVSLARSLASQASIALENAHLHRIVERQAATDELTQLANRRAFMDALAGEKRRSDRSRDPFAVVVADLDDFKRVNDRFGHQTGDRVLCVFARVVERELRGVDIPARIGGEEFAILLPQTDLSGAAALAERIRAAFVAERLTSDRGEVLAATSSFGVAVYASTDSAETLLGAADAALYRAKAAGRNRVTKASRRAVDATNRASRLRRRPTAS